ncbi:MAG: polyphosphate kinase 1, partial [Spirochaetia bacterium]|nr:polyphosphate kinase 1 [Spirochaetia bacterium]
MSSHPTINRELAWIEFNARVLNEATKDFIPLLERLKFLSIVSSNFDEFFMVRIAGLKNEIRTDAERGGELPAGILAPQPPQKVLEAVAARVRELVTLQYSCLTQDVLPGLAKAGLELLAPPFWSPSLKSYLEAYFVEQVFPLVTALRFDEDEALPTIGNLQIHCAFELSDREGKRHYALAQVPKNSRRFILLPDEEGGQEEKFRFALMEDLIISFASKLFPGFSVEGALVFKVTRDADTGVDESRQEDFLSAMEEVLAGRQNSTPVRLSYSGSSLRLEAMLRKRLELDEIDCYRLDGPIDLAGFYELVSLELKGEAGKASGLRDRPWKPIALPGSEGTSVWEEIETRDRLLFLPYESFGAIQRFLDEAADDPSVLAIKMTLYRTSGDSPVVKALIRAARNRKQVAVVVELKARFDEERNISWASTLEQAGAIVTYGVAKLKVHAKAALVLRRARDGSIRRYLHLSTGNYNDKTARIYSDLSLFTANAELCREASAFFN